MHGTPELTMYLEDACLELLPSLATMSYIARPYNCSRSIIADRDLNGGSVNFSSDERRSLPFSHLKIVRAVRLCIYALTLALETPTSIQARFLETLLPGLHPQDPANPHPTTCPRRKLVCQVEEKSGHRVPTWRPRKGRHSLLSAHEFLQR